MIFFVSRLLLSNFDSLVTEEKENDTQLLYR